MTDTLVALGILWRLFPDLHPDLTDLVRKIGRQREAEGDAGGVRELAEWLERQEQ